MKRLIVLSLMLFAFISFKSEANTIRDRVGGYFYTELSPYGTWVELDYGVIVWRPRIVVVDWMPYQTGRWVWTEDGWYWDSYEPFGYVTYHYGRWYYDDYYGWLWYPDYEWAPAWVEWRYDDYYIGWAPLSPYATFSISVGISFTHTYYTPYYHWNFVKYNRFCDPYVYNYYVGSSYRYRIYEHTKYRTNYVYHDGRIQNRGVDIKYVRNRSGQDIKKRDIIRVTDSRQISKDGYRNNNQIRTLDLKREELTRNDVKNMNIKRENHKSSLDISKVEIGDRNKNIRTVYKDQNVNSKNNVRNINKTQKNDQVIRKDVNKKNIETKRNVDIKKNNNVNNNRNDVTKNRTNEQKKVQNEKRTVNKNQINKNEQPKVNKNQVNRNEQINKDKRKQQTTVNQQKNIQKEKLNVTRKDQQIKKNTNFDNRKTDRKVQTNRTTNKDNTGKRNRR